MPHDTTFFAILAMLFYIFVPQYFGYVAIALAFWLGFPAIKVVWQTTRDLRDISGADDEANNEDEAEAENEDDKADEE